MALFGNKKETYGEPAEAKRAPDVIRNDSPDKQLIWKHPKEEFETKAIVLVMPGEEAIFIKDGRIEQAFECGKYKLSPENYPFVSRLRSCPEDGSVFRSEIYFVRLDTTEELHWSTESPIRVRDNYWRIRTSVRVTADYRLCVSDAAKLLELLLSNGIGTERPEPERWLVRTLQQPLTDAVACCFGAIQENLIDSSERLEALSREFLPTVDEKLRAFALRCVSFRLTEIDADLNDYKPPVPERRKEKDTLLPGLFQKMAHKVFQTPCQPDGGPLAQEKQDPEQALATLKKLLDLGLILQSDYDRKKTELLSGRVGQDAGGDVPEQKPPIRV